MVFVECDIDHGRYLEEVAFVTEIAQKKAITPQEQIDENEVL